MTRSRGRCMLAWKLPSWRISGLWSFPAEGKTGAAAKTEGRGCYLSSSGMAATKLLLPTTPPPPSPPRFCHQNQRWCGCEPWPGPGRRHVEREHRRKGVFSIKASLLHETIEAVNSSNSAPLVPLFSLAAAAEGSVGYSIASYYTSLGLFVISVPGLWSLIKRSVKSKIAQKTFEVVGEKKTPNQVAGEILSFFTRNNFTVSDRGEAITFEGMMVPSRGQAALLTFCTCISLASIALVLSITLPEGGNNWFWLTALSPLAGAYYWKRASRKEEIKVKMMVAEDGSLSELVVRGDDEQVEQLRKELQLSEKGMVYVKGIFER